MISTEDKKILIVDDEPDMLWVLTTLLEEKGYCVITAEDGKEAMEKIRRKRPNLALLDIKLPKASGMYVLEKTREIDLRIPVIMMTAFGDIQSAVKAMKLGAYDYIVKPFDNDELLFNIERALENRLPIDEFSQLSTLLDEPEGLYRIMGKSSIVQGLVTKIKRVAPSDFCILIQGETGAGKELVAEAIHINSSRAELPFVVVDCGAIPETLFESELFGYEKGAFTGAYKRKDGLFEKAHTGTLFFDEVTNLPKSMQRKLLRVLQTKLITHLGGTKEISVDVRILCTTNRDLLAEVEKGNFRRDLYYRIDEFTLTVPPLRERKDDILFLANFFLDEVVRELNKKIDGFSKEAENLLLMYNWPGNVRQLRNVVRKSALLADRIITEQCFPNALIECLSGNISMIDSDSQTLEGLSLKELKKYHQTKLEEQVLTKVLRQTRGNKWKAAQLLKIDYKTIHTKVKELGIQIDEFD